MNIKKSLTSVFLGASLLGGSFASAQDQPEAVDFNKVGKEMAKMLMNRHYEKLKFDEKLSDRIFKLYMMELDAGKMFFTQQDVDKLKAQFGKQLHAKLLQEESTDVAEAAYSVYKERVIERVAFSKKVLAESKFTFDSDRTVARSRKKVEKWPANKAESDQMWRNLVEEAVLGETLRRENIARLAKEQGKENPLKNQKPIKQVVQNRYERILKAVQDEDNEDIANYFLSAFAKAYGPHTDYFSAREFERFSSGMNNEFVGIGALLQAEDDGATKIKGIVVGGPAAKGGDLQLNDRIVGVDSNSTGEMVDIMFMRINKVVELIRGKPGSTVTLKVERGAGEIMLIKIKRGKVEMGDDFASGKIIDTKQTDGTSKRIGVITLPSFYVNFETRQNRCSDHVRDILKRMVDEKIDGLILDLRGNGGGSLEEVRIMTGLFTGVGPVVQEKDSASRISMQSSYRKAIYDGPMLCLIDQTSASASEILAGALQDYNRALIVGSGASFGKGTVQQAMDIKRMLPINAQGRNRAGYLKPTIRKFYRVAGSSTQNKGVESDIVLPGILDSIEVGEKFLEYPLPYDEIEPADGFKPAPRENLFLAKIKAESTKRVNASKDFNYLKDDVNRMKKRLEENKLSLNKISRLALIDEIDKRNKNRNKERIKRYKDMQKKDNAVFTFYRMNRDDLKNPLKAYDPTKDDESYMIKAKDDTADLDVTPEFPSRLDPTMRESIEILDDLISLNHAAKVAAKGSN